MSGFIQFELDFFFILLLSPVLVQNQNSDMKKKKKRRGGGAEEGQCIGRKNRNWKPGQKDISFPFTISSLKVSNQYILNICESFFSQNRFTFYISSNRQADR